MTTETQVFPWLLDTLPVEVMVGDVAYFVPYAESHIGVFDTATEQFRASGERSVCLVPSKTFFRVDVVALLAHL